AAAGSGLGEAWLTGNLGMALIDQGQVDRGIGLLERALELCEVHAPTSAGIGHAMIAAAQLDAGRAEEALGAARRAAAFARTLGSPTDEAYAHALEGETLLVLGRNDEARTLLEGALASALDHGDTHAVHRARRALGRLHSTLGDHEGALVHLESALAAAVEDGLRSEATAARKAIAGVRERAGDFEAAYRALRDAVDPPPDTGSPSEERLHRSVEEYLARFGPRAALTLISASCKSVHDGVGDRWNPLEGFLTRRLDVRLSHGLCPTCFKAEIEAL
ncbi:MAG: tetratricopeptide repeat protein, partial [Actinobacteria bacterium]|nr:tetratricopeptide repeat protein [Actinomycetota bacterium]